MTAFKPLLPCNLKDRILALKEPATLRDLMAAETDRTVTLAVHDRGILMDADDRDGYARVQNKARFLDIPDREECLSIVDQELPEEHPIRDHLAQVAMTALKLAHAVSDPANVDLVIAAARTWISTITSGSGTALKNPLGHLQHLETV